MAKIRYNYPLAPLTWFKVGGPAAIFAKCSTKMQLIEFIKQQSEPAFILGAGSNILVRDGGMREPVVRLIGELAAIKLLDNGQLLVGAGCPNHHLAQVAAEYGISGFEFLIGIPGTIGGGVAMNAGAYGSEFKDIVEEIYAIDQSGKEIIFSNAEAGFTYRANNIGAGIIFTHILFTPQIAVTLESQADANLQKQLILNKMVEINQQRRATQPISAKTGGSTFANPPGHKAWQLIDQAGMRGKTLGQAMVSKQHCNFLINLGGATCYELEELGLQVQAEVAKQTNINLRWEIKRLGRAISPTQQIK